jgi:hypothetical protein
MHSQQRVNTVVQLPLPSGSPSPFPQPVGPSNVQLPLAPGMPAPQAPGATLYKPRPSMGVLETDAQGRPISERREISRGQRRNLRPTGEGYEEVGFMYVGGRPFVTSIKRFTYEQEPIDVTTKTYTRERSPRPLNVTHTDFISGQPAFKEVYGDLQSDIRHTTYSVAGSEPKSVTIKTRHDVTGRAGEAGTRAMRDVLNLKQESEAAYRQRSAVSEQEYEQAFAKRQQESFLSWEREQAANPLNVRIMSVGMSNMKTGREEEYFIPVERAKTTSEQNAELLAWERETAKDPLNVAVTTKGQVLRMQEPVMSEATVKVPQFKTDKYGNVLFQQDFLGVPSAVREYKEYKMSELPAGYAEFGRAYPGKEPTLRIFQNEMFIEPTNPKSMGGRKLSDTPFEAFYNVQTYFMRKRAEAKEFSLTYPSTGSRVLSNASGFVFGAGTVFASPEMLSMPIGGGTTVVKGGRTIGAGIWGTKAGLNISGSIASKQPELLYVASRSLEAVPYIGRVPIVRSLWSGTVQDAMLVSLGTQVATTKGREEFVTQFKSDPYFTVGSSSPLIYGITRDVISSFPGRYPLEPSGVTIDRYRKKEFGDYARLVRISTKEPIALKPVLAFERVEGTSPKTASFLRDFFKEQELGFIGGSVIHESIRGVELKRKPQDIEWYTPDANFGLRLQSAASKAGLRVTSEGHAWFVDGVKIDVNPAYLGQRNIETVIPRGSDWTKYVVKSGEGISIVDPRVIMRRSLVGAFEKGGETGEPMARYSKDIPRLFSTTEQALSQRRMMVEQRAPLYSQLSVFQDYRTRVGELLLERYTPPTGVNIERLTPIKYRGYEQTIDYPAFPTKIGKDIFGEAVKEGGYLAGSSALYFQVPGFRKPAELDIYFQKGRKFTVPFGEALAKKYGLIAETRSHTLLFETAGAREIVDIAPRMQKEKIRIINDVPVRDWKLIVKDKMGIIRSIETKQKLGKDVSDYEFAKYEKAVSDVAFVKAHAGESFATSYSLKNRFVDVRALDEFGGTFSFPGKKGEYIGAIEWMKGGGSLVEWARLPEETKTGFEPSGEVWTHFTTARAAEKIKTEGFKYGKTGEWTIESGGNLADNAVFLTRDIANWGRSVKKDGDRGAALTPVRFELSKTARVFRIDTLNKFVKEAKQVKWGFDLENNIDVNPAYGIASLKKVISAARRKGFDAVVISDKKGWGWESKGELKRAGIKENIHGETVFDYVNRTESIFRPNAYDFITGGSGYNDLIVFNRDALRVVGTKRLATPETISSGLFGKKGQFGGLPITNEVSGSTKLVVGGERLTFARALERSERSLLSKATREEGVVDFGAFRKDAGYYFRPKEYDTIYAGVLSGPYGSVVADSYVAGPVASYDVPYGKTENYASVSGYPVKYPSEYTAPYTPPYVPPYTPPYKTGYPTTYVPTYVPPYVPPYTPPYKTDYPYPYPVTVPFPIKTPPPVIPLPRKKKDEGERKKAYKVQIKRRGKFINIGGALPFGKALEFGSKRTRETLAATFRLKEVGTTDLPDTQYPVSTKFFRNYAVKSGQRVDLPLTFIQRRGTRLGTSGEVSEIGYERKSKRRTDQMMGGLFSV